MNISKIVKIINDIGIKTYSFDYSIYSQYIDLWFSWYKGYDPAFHVQKEYYGFSKPRVNKKATLNMGSQVCKDHASLTCNENISISVAGNKEKDFLLGFDEMNGLLGQNDFWSQLASFYEITCALGTGSYEIVVDNLLDFGTKIVADDNSRIRLVHHNATEIIPLSWDNNKNIIDVAFVDQYKIKNESFIDLRIHNLEDSGYVIYNKRLKVFGDNYTIEKDNDTLDKFETHSSIPWFYILKLPIVNNYDINSPMGMSVYGNAIDVLKNVDDAFNALSIEYKTSAKKVFYNKSLLNTNDKGEPIDPDTANQTAFYYVGDTNNPMLSQDTPIKEHDPNIRVDELTKGLESALGYLSALCGLGNSYYKFTSGSVVKTATEVVSENSSMYRNIRKNELAVEKMLLGLFRGILNISNLLYGTSFDIDTHISVMFDTSIIEDKSSIRERDLKEVELGIMTIDEYREKWYNVNRRDTSNKTKVDME